MLDFQTQYKVCEYMVSLLPDGIKTVLEPTPGEGNLVSVLQDKKYIVTAPVNFWEIHGKWDAIVMNPPFTPMSLGYGILFRCLEMSEVIIALMPWLVLINGEKRKNKLVDFGLVSVTHLPRNVFPGSRVQTCILNLRKGFCGTSNLLFY